MKIEQIIGKFSKKYPLFGPIFWMSNIQYFAIQLIAAQSWKVSYSLSRNTISDLGNSVCGIYSSRLVCSPKYALMNASFMTLGLTMAIGSALIYQKHKKSQLNLIGFSFMGIAGFGTLIVGLFPENTVVNFHVLGAALPFLIGNLGLVILGLVLDVPKLLKYYTLLSGVAALVALVLFIGHQYLGLGIGGMERVVAYPQTVWLIIFGGYQLSRSLPKTRTSQ